MHHCNEEKVSNHTKSSNDGYISLIRRAFLVLGAIELSHNISAKCLYKWGLSLRNIIAVSMKSAY